MAAAGLTNWERMTKRRLARFLPLLCASACASGSSRAAELLVPSDAPPSAWIIDLGSYSVLEPTHEGSKHYNLAFRPIFEFWQAGEREWIPFPNDAFDFNLFESSDFHAGPSVSVALQSRFHGEDIDLRLGKADVDLAGGAFAEYYPVSSVRTRIEMLQGVTGNSGFAANLSADYIWHPAADWTLTAGPRAQIADDRYASDYFSMQNAEKTGFYAPFRAEGGILSSGAEITGKYEWTQQISTKFFLDYNQLVGDAADDPRVSARGSAEQVLFGIGASYKFAVQP